MSKQQKQQQRDVSGLLGFLLQEDEVHDAFVTACQAALGKVGWKMSGAQILEAIEATTGGRVEFARQIRVQTGVEIPVTAAPAPVTKAEPEVVDMEAIARRAADQERVARVTALQTKVLAGKATPAEIVEYGQLLAGAPTVVTVEPSEPAMPPLTAGYLGDFTGAGVIIFTDERHAFMVGEKGGWRRSGKTTNLAHGQGLGCYGRFYAAGVKTDLGGEGTPRKVAERLVKKVRSGSDEYHRFLSVRTWSPDDSTSRGGEDGKEKAEGAFVIYEFVGDDFSVHTLAYVAEYDFAERRVRLTGETIPFKFQAPPESVEDVVVPF